MTQHIAHRTVGNGKLVALCTAIGLLVGAGVVTPFALNYRSSMQQAQKDAQDAAARAEQSRQEAVALEQQKAEMRENLGQAEKTITTLQTDLTERSGTLDALKQIDAQRLKEVQTLRADIQSKAAEMADLHDRLALARTEVEGATKQTGELTIKVNGLRGEVSRMSETIDVQRTEIKRLVEVVNKTEAEKQVAIKDAQDAHATVVVVQKELMTLAPVRIEERRSTLTGRKIAKSSGVPLAGIFDPIGDAFQGISEGLFGKTGPVEMVAVYKDGREETLANADASRWAERGIQVVRLSERESTRTRDHASAEMY